MLVDIINGISIKLNAVFGDECNIYTENVKQGLDNPCFFIQALPTRDKVLIGKRKKRTYSFMITYFPADEETNEDMMNVGDTLQDELEYITLVDESVMRGVNREFEILYDEEVLQFSVEFNVILNAVAQETLMESLEEKVGTKES